MHNGKQLREELNHKKSKINEHLKELNKVKSDDKQVLKELKDQKEILQKQYSNYELSEEEIIERTALNAGLFSDLVAGAVRQLDRKVESLIELNNLQCQK
jgi:hypothetical protein